MAACLLALALGVASVPYAGGAAQQGSSSRAPHNKSSHANDYLVFATVFTERGFALPGAEVRIRRAGEKKVRWQGVSDSRGEFAIHMPRGAEYEMTVRAKGYQEQTQKVDAKTGSRADLVVHMAPLPAPGEKPQ